MIDEVNTRLKQNDISIEVTDKAKDLLAEEGFDPMWCKTTSPCNPKRIEDKISEELLKRNISKGDVLIIDADENDITFKKKELTPTMNL